MNEQQITIGKTIYTVKPVTDPQHKEHVAYELISAKRHYYLLRNVPNPSMLFAIADGMRSPSWWFTDKSGKLEQIK